MKVRKHSDRVCTSNRKITAQLLLSFLAVSPTLARQQSPLPAIEPWIPMTMTPQDDVHEFTLRHVFHRGTYQDPNLHVRLDVPPDRPIWVSGGDDLRPQRIPSLHIDARSNPTRIERLKDRRPSQVESHLSYARLNRQPAILDASEWTLDDVPAPNITDKDTVINLAIMAANAYVSMPGDPEWENVTQGFNESRSFGWEGDGLRGHIFADKDNQTVVVALKGTSPAVFDGDGTTTRDKLNDNLFFSCCCAQGGQYFWRQVCDCYTSTYTCNQTCLEQSLRQENRYYRAAIDLYTNVTELYPDSNLWVVGHSLGGAVSSLLGMTFGLPVVTFEAPGDDLAAKRLGLPAPPSSDPHLRYRRPYSGSVHIGHTADPVFMGTCNGATATCTLGGYAMESQCHTGLQCVYDTVGDYGWRVGIGNHKIHNVIDNIIRKYPTVAKCVPDDECVDCFNWKYFNSNGSDSTSTSTTITTTSTRTRTTTCKTPGWWGCLDESTKTHSTVPVVTTTYTTTSCATPGWFGCNKEVNVTVTTTTELPTSYHSASATHTSTSSCEHPGWFGGCHDTTISASPSHTSTLTKPTSSPSSHTTCKTPGFFWGCRDKKTTSVSTATPSSTITPAPIPSASTTPRTSTSNTHSSPPKKEKKCKHPALFGLICLDNHEDNDNAVAGATSSPTVTETGWYTEL